jgi:hypothetical protein
MGLTLLGFATVLAGRRDPFPDRTIHEFRDGKIGETDGQPNGLIAVLLRKSEGIERLHGGCGHPHPPDRGSCYNRSGGTRLKHRVNHF